MLSSIIIPCYKMGRFIGEALAAVAKQTYTNWEVIAVDDCGPEDGTRQAVEGFAGCHPGRRVVFHRHPENRGVSAARNTAIGMAGGEYLAFLDPDDWWEADYLQRQVRCMEGDKAPGVAYTGTMMVDAGGGPLNPWEPPASYDEGMPEAVFTGNYINPSATVVRRDIAVAVGGFDETPALQHVEDWDLWIRLALAGAVFRRSDAPRVNYRQHAGAACADRSKVTERCLALMCKHGNNPRMMRCLIDRSEKAEGELGTLRTEYADLLKAHSRTMDRRIKSLLTRMIGRSK
jgi:glycosyltransferase involved in cell wall biosynthesis